LESGVDSEVSKYLRYINHIIIIIIINLRAYLGVSTIDSVCLSVPLSVTPLSIASSFLFLDGIEPFWPSFLHVALYKTLFLDL